MTADTVMTVCAWPDYSWCLREELEEQLLAAGRSDDYVMLNVDVGDHDSWAEIVDAEVEAYFGYPSPGYY